MEVSKKRKRDVDCPRITYDATTKVFDRLFKEESLEEMKNVVRKKLGLSYSLPVHLSQLRDGKSVVLEDEDDFDAFYASVHSNAVARIQVYLDDDQLSMASPDSGMQLPGSPTVYHTAVDGHTSSKKRKVTFFEPTPQPVGDNVEEVDSLPNFEAPVHSDVAAIEVSGSSTKTVHVSENTPHNAVKSKKRRKTSAIADDAADAAGYPRVSKKSKHKHKDSKDGAADPTDDNQADSRTKLPEDPQRHTPSIAQADPEVILAQPPKETRKRKKKVEVVIVDKGPKDALSTPISATSNGTVAVKHTKKNPKPPASISALETNSKGNTENPGSSQGLKTPAKPTPNEDDTQCEQKTTVSGEGKKKSRINGAPVESVETNSTQDPGPKFDLTAANRAAVAAILARNFLHSEETRQTTSSSSPLADVIAPSPSVAPVTSSSPENHLIPPNNTSTTAEQPNAAPKCPVCNKTPSHVRSRCPIIKAGVKSIRQRIAELQQDTSEGNNEERKKVIEELQRIIDKRTQGNQAPTTENKSTNLKSMADKPIIGDISSYTAQDLEALIRGPNITLADVPSSDSSGDEEVLEEEPEEMQIELSRFQGRMQYPSSSEEEEEEEEEASSFVPSIIPLPIRSVSELPNEDESSRSDDIPVPSEHGRKVIGDILSAQVPDESELQMASDVARPPVTIATPRPTPQSDPIEAFEQLEASSPQSSIVSMEEDIHPLQSTPKTGVASRKTADLTSKPSRMGVNGVSNHSSLIKKTGGLTRIMDLPVPTNPAIRVIKPVGVQTRRQTARAEEEEEEEEADEQGPTTDTSQAKGKNGQLSGSKTSPGTTKTPAKIPKTPAKTPVKTSAKTPAKTPAKPSAKTPTKTPATTPKVPVYSNVETRSLTVVKNALETKKSAISDAEQSLASWAVLEGNSLAESETLKMVDELRYSPDMPDFPTPAQRPISSTVVNGVSKAPDALFLHSESQQSFPYSQYPKFSQEPPGSEDEEDEVQASVIKPQMTTKSSSKFRSLTEIASQPALFTTMNLTKINNTKEEAMNLYGRTSKDEEESEDSDTSESDAGVKAQTSHIPLSRRAGSCF